MNTAGGIVVVVGYAMVIHMMKVNYLMQFFFLGFVIAAFSNYNLLSLGIIGSAIAIIYIQLNPKYFNFNNKDLNNRIHKNHDDELD